MPMAGGWVDRGVIPDIPLEDHTASRNLPSILEFTSVLLADYGDRAWHQPATDAGPAILARLIADTSTAHANVAFKVMDVWLTDYMESIESVGLHGGFAGLLAGCTITESMTPSLSRLTARVVERLGEELAQRLNLPAEIGWEDYDLISGLSGVLATLASATIADPDHVNSAAGLLAKLCRREDLGDLRVSSPRLHGNSQWNHGRVNTGVAHGAAGVLAALCCAADAIEPREELLVTVKRVAEWLRAKSYRDDLGVVSWFPCDGAYRGSTGSVRRQAWCYGTPGIAWTLWEAGRILGADDLMGFAAGAMNSFCHTFDEVRYLSASARSPWEKLGFCHGASGMLAITDSFARNAGHSACAGVSERLERYIESRLADVALMARDGMDLLNGAAGPLATLIVARGGDRGWLRSYGLR